jgi:putative ABC transport system permease protein
MKISENFTMAAKNLRGNLVRSMLTMLGVIIGVTAVIVMVSLGEGAKQQITKSITAMGSNLLIVFPGSGSQHGGSFGSASSLTNAILPVIQNCSTYIANIAPEARGRQMIKTANNSIQSPLIGCTSSYLSVRNYQIESGSFFSEDDLKGRRRVAVIGSYGQVRLKIIGVLQEKGQSGFGNNDDLVLVPLTTAQQRFLGNKNLSTIYIQAKDEQSMDALSNQLYDALLKELRDETKFTVRNQAEILSTVQEATKTFTLLLAGIAAVSLLVGGIGIMNIMLVSVTERIKEIGIRKAVGAQKEEILALFLIEAVVLSVIGGIIGIMLGWGLASLISSFTGWSTVISLSSVLISFFFSILTGLFFGVYPAYKASGLHPIDALRYE